MRSSNRYIIVPVGAAFDILAYATSMLCLYKFGRRLPLTIALVVTGIALQCTAPAPLGKCLALSLKHLLKYCF